MYVKRVYCVCRMRRIKMKCNSISRISHLMNINHWICRDIHIHFRKTEKQNSHTQILSRLSVLIAAYELLSTEVLTLYVVPQGEIPPKKKENTNLSALTHFAFVHIDLWTWRYADPFIAIFVDARNAKRLSDQNSILTNSLTSYIPIRSIKHPKRKRTDRLTELVSLK